MKRLILLVVLFTACVPYKPPVVAPPVVPATMTVHVQVGLPDAAVALQTTTGWVSCTTDTTGHCYVIVPASLSDSQLTVALNGYLPLSQHVVVARDITLTVMLTAPRPPPLSRLAVHGQYFRLETGQGFTAIQVSDFNLFNRFQNSEDIEPILQQRQDLGFNLLRVWTLYDLAGASIGVLLNPDYAKIPAFLDACAAHHLYVEFTAYTSTERVEHWGKLIAAVQGSSNAMLELVNEEDQAPNRLVHFAEYQRPTGVLASHGSNGSQAWPVEPKWDYVTFHSNGASEEQRKVGHNAMEIWSGPTLTNETSRYPDVGMWIKHSDESDVEYLARVKRHAYDSAAGGALLPAGSCFHSVAGKTSRLFAGDELEVARAWVAGARSVDLACQGGPYTHQIDLEKDHPELIRVYERPVAGHDCVVKIRK